MGEDTIKRIMPVIFVSLPPLGLSLGACANDGEKESICVRNQSSVGKFKRFYTIAQTFTPLLASPNLNYYLSNDLSAEKT